MKTSHVLVAAALAVATATPASALTLFNTDNPTGVTFTGFDWAQGGTAYTTGFQPVAGDTFTLTYFAWAISVQNGLNPLPNNKQTNLDTIADGTDGGNNLAYEYTVVATVNETVDSCTGLGTTGSCTFSITGGSFNIYYDTTPNANATNGTGYTDGISIVSGDLFGPDTTFTTSLVSGVPSGQAIATLFGTNLVVNTTYIQPPPTDATSATTLQLGKSQTNGYVAPTGFEGSALPGSPDVVFQADGNSSFSVTRIPEPASLALLGLGLGVAGLTFRRRRS